MFFNGFPTDLKDDVLAVIKTISMKTYHNTKYGLSENFCDYTLLDSQMLSFPYRIYFIDVYNTLPSTFTFEQRMIYHAIFTRSCDGFVREKHLKAILSEDFPSWIIPYIVKLTDEYIVEILDATYQMLNREKADEIKAFCQLNIQSFLRSHDRMISYWNEFYRNKCFLYENYIGKKLYSDCFGYSRSMEKLRENEHNMKLI